MLAVKKFALATLAIATGGILTSTHSAFAAETITANFIGEITASNCSVSASNATVSVPLGSVPANTFTSVGSQSKDTPFTLNFSNCPTRNISVTAQGTADPANSNYLALTNRGNQGVASGVAILLKRNGSTLPLSSAVNLGQPDGSGNLAVNLTAAYISTASVVSAGTANSTATFTLSYP